MGLPNLAGYGKAYWLTPEGQYALEFLIAEARISCGTIPKLSYKMPPKMDLDQSTTHKQIIDQINQINYPKGVSLQKWGEFVGYYYDKLSAAQIAICDQRYPYLKIMSWGDAETKYLMNQNPFPLAIGSETTISADQKLAELMWNLDYGKLSQEKRFRSIILTKSIVGAAFSLSVCDQNLQNWLVYRLMRWVNYATWDEIEIRHDKYDDGWSLSYIWEQIARNNKDEYLSNIIQDILDISQDNFTEANNDFLISVFVKYINKRHILIKIKNIQKSNLEILVNKFWNPLFLQLNRSTTEANQELRLLMFIVNDHDLRFDNNCRVHCLEPPLNINYHDIEKWIDSPNVKKHLLKVEGKTEKAIQRWLTHSVSSWTCDLPDLFDNLIPYVSYQSTFAKVSKLWKI